MRPGTPQIEDISSEDEIFDSDQEDHSGTPVLEGLLMGREELENYDSLSPPVNKTPFWKFAEQTTSGSQTKTKASTTRAQPPTSTPAKPAAPQVKAQAQAKPQAPAQAQMQPPAPAQPVQPAPAY